MPLQTLLSIWNALVSLAASLKLKAWRDVSRQILSFLYAPPCFCGHFLTFVSLGDGELLNNRDHIVSSFILGARFSV